MSSTANSPSSRVTDLQVTTSSSVAESNNASDNANSQTPSSGFFLLPSTITGRSADITDFIVTSQNEYGKLGFSDPDGLLSLTELSDVTITAPAANQVLLYNGTIWVNGSTPAGDAAGNDTEVQFNDGGDLAGDALFTFDSGTTTLTVAGTITDGTASLIAGALTGITNITASGTITDGTASLVGGSLTGLTDVTSAELTLGAQSSGTATLVAGTVTVNSTVVAAGDTIFLTQNTPGGTTGTHYTVEDANITPGASFVIEATDTAGALVNTDTSTVNWMIVH